jgi:predicted alpha/beta-hydrolase family hydrolase
LSKGCCSKQQPFFGYKRCQSSSMSGKSSVFRVCFKCHRTPGHAMCWRTVQARVWKLVQRGIATLRYQFPYMERGSKRPNTPKVAHATVRAAVLEAARLVPGLALFAGGKSFGGRMTSQAQAAAPLPGVRGLVFLGFPLHPPGKQSDERGKHLFDVQLPMLFLQGTRDELANLGLMEALCRQLGARATLKLFQEGDHSFHVPARTGRKDAEVRAELLETMADWINKISSVSDGRREVSRDFFRQHRLEKNAGPTPTPDTKK